MNILIKKIERELERLQLTEQYSKQFGLKLELMVNCVSIPNTYKISNAYKKP